MSESSSLNDSKESKSSLCELSCNDFEKIKETITFVDKTLFIKSVLSDLSKIVLLTAPRAFGKTTLMNMLKQFLLGKKDLFKNLNIFTEEGQFFSKHCKHKPVIHIDLGVVSGSSFNKVKHSLALAINATFEEHGYLVKKTDDGTTIWASEKLNISNIQIESFEKFYYMEECTKLGEGDLENSLKFLSKVLYTHYEEKVFVLIDEYDAPAIGLVFEHPLNKDDINRIHFFLQRFMSSTLKFNTFTERSLIFACVRLAGALSGNAARVIKHYPFLSDIRYAPYFGFTGTEIQQLLERPEVKAACGKVSFKTISKWYDGYVVSNSEVKIFSSWSVLNLLLSVLQTGIPKYTSFWIDTGYVENLKQLFTEPSVREKIEQILSSDEIKIKAVTSVSIEHLKSLKKIISLEFDNLSDENVELFLQFLSDSGYFNMFSVDDKKYEISTKTQYSINIPNFEIRKHIHNTCYSEALRIVHSHNLSFSNIEKYLDALQLVCERTSKRDFIDLANAVLILLSQSSQRIMSEKQLHHILYTLTYNCKLFITRSEVQIKKTRKGPGIANTLDVVIIFKNIGIIFEYKMNSQSAQKALRQIFENRYYTKFNEPEYIHISKKIYAGLAFKAKANEVSITFQVGNKGKHISVCSDYKL